MIIIINININIITNLLYNICFEDELFYILNQEDVKPIVGVKFMFYINRNFGCWTERSFYQRKMSSLVKFSKVEK